MSIRQELEQFDGKHVGALEALLENRAPSSLVRSLVNLVGDSQEKIQVAVTWLLKRLAENDARFKTEHLIVLFSSLSELTHWLSKLHVCQMLQYVAIPEESAENVVWFLERNLMDENRFLRAWSYNGFYELARQHPKYVGYATEQLERGETEPAASVKARIRKIRKALNKLAS
jgi:hypothetical protein